MSPLTLLPAHLQPHSFYGFAIGGPITHLWYLALEHTYGPSRALSTSLAKMATDQILAAPVFTATFFAVNGILEARKLEEVRERVRRDLWSTLKVGFWTAEPGCIEQASHPFRSTHRQTGSSGHSP